MSRRGLSYGQLIANVFKITIVRKNHRAGQPRPYILVNRISLFVKRSSAGSARPISDYCELPLIHYMTARLFFGCTILLTCEAEGDFLQHRKKDFAL